ncbi:MAG TPA: hypothetical protein VM939_11165 [Gemmatimonadaceae bacterium]|nr:hypothetical protein [Gemmatimonadaceae bacterium]
MELHTNDPDRDNIPPDHGRRDPSKEPRGDRRRGGWRDFRRAYPGFIFTLVLGLLAMIALDGFLIYKRGIYEAEVARLRASMTDTERAKTDAIIEAEENKARLALELARRQAKLEKTLHLSVAVDSGRIYLEREGAVLREMPAAFGPEAMLTNGSDSIPIVIPRGQRTVAKVSSEGISLDGGTVIAPTKAEILANDSTPIPPGSVRIRESDLKAILPNLSLGTRVYFY